MQLVSFVLNLPWTFLGLVAAIISIPRKITLNRNPLAIIVSAKSFWWYKWLPSKIATRAMTNGHIVILGPLRRNRDLEHELIHVQQAIAEPLIHPILYFIESLKHGYRHNKYEVEAYTKTDSKYVERIE